MPETESDEGSPAGSEAPVPSLVGVLADLRRRCGLTQEELAERSGLTARAISDLERGAVRRPRRTTVERLAAALGLAGAEADRFVALARGHSLGPVTPGDAVPEPAAAPLPRDLVRAFGREGRVVAGALPWFPEEDGTPVLPATAIAVVHLAVELMAVAMLEALSLHGGREVAAAAVRRALAQLQAAQADPTAAGPPAPDRPA
ncbi:MAG TPA: helix-turn-helix transcriptional regulator [Mycobacteriales bacterium]